MSSTSTSSSDQVSSSSSSSDSHSSPAINVGVSANATLDVGNESNSTISADLTDGDSSGVKQPLTDEEDKQSEEESYSDNVGARVETVPQADFGRKASIAVTLDASAVVKPKKSKKKKSKKSKSSKSSSSSKETLDVNGDDGQLSSGADDEVPFAELLREDFMRTVDERHLIKDTDRVQMVWTDIKYRVKVPNPDAEKYFLGCVKRGEKKQIDKHIIKGMTGYVPPGCLLGIIGPSGAGKTTFLNILAHRITGKHVTGSVKINGQKADSALLRQISGFVSQEDVLMGSLTAREALMFAANLKLPKHTSQAEKKQKVDKLLTQLGLYHVRNNYIGFSGATARNSGIKRGLSGGEKKRVSVAIELITDPKILFLDEPTSGLDSFAAKAVMDGLRNLAFHGRTIICTIHQPSADIYRLFDKLMILAEGQTVYYGDLPKTVPYFAGIGYKCPPFKNPADYLMKILHVTPTDEVDAEEETLLKHVTTDQVDGMIKKYKKSKLSKQATKPPKHEHPIHRESKADRVSDLTKFWLLFIRSLRNVWREPLLFKTRIVQAIFSSVLAGLIYLRLDNDQTGIRDRTSALFFVTVSTAFAGINGPTYIFPAERGVVFREQGSGLYGTASYFFAKFFSELPVNFIVPVITAAISYWMIGWSNSFTNFLMFNVVIFMTVNTAFAIGMILSAAIHDVALATRIQPMILIPCMLFSGFFLNADNIPVYFIWLEKISFFRWAFEGLVIAGFRGENFKCVECDFRIPCDTQNTTMTDMLNTTMNAVNSTITEVMNCTIPSGAFTLPSDFNGGSPLSCSGFTLNPNDTVVCPITTGDQQIMRLNFEEDNFWMTVGITAAIWFVLEVGIYLLLRFNKGKQ